MDSQSSNEAVITLEIEIESSDDLPFFEIFDDDYIEEEDPSTYDEIVEEDEELTDIDDESNEDDEEEIEEIEEFEEDEEEESESEIKEDEKMSPADRLANIKEIDNEGLEIESIDGEKISELFSS